MPRHLIQSQAAQRAERDIAPSKQASPISSVVAATSLADEVAFRLEAAIISRELPPGTRLRQEELCQRFGVSRTPIREALRKLQALRLVKMVPNKGATVRLPTRTEIEEVYDLRGELEAFAAELASSRAQPITDAELARAIEVLRRRPTPQGVSTINDSNLNIAVSSNIRNFHHIIHEAAGNGRLISVLRELESQFPGDYCSHEMAHPIEARSLHVDDHERIYQAILARDGTAARVLMKEHIERSKSILLRHLDEHRVWEQSQG